MFVSWKAHCTGAAVALIRRVCMTGIWCASTSCHAGTECLIEMASTGRIVGACASERALFAPTRVYEWICLVEEAGAVS